jgi:hypothetical protein
MKNGARLQVNPATPPWDGAATSNGYVGMQGARIAEKPRWPQKTL